MKKYTRVYADINLDNIEYNVRALMALTKPGTKAMAVVKADAYGHGDVAVAKAVNDIVDAYAVATVEEGINLRQNGIEKMILVLGYVDEMHYDQVIRYALSIPVFDTEMAKKMSAAAVAAGENIRCHVKVDTGMHRIGLRPDDDGIKTVLALAKYDGLDVEGIFTHFSKADETDKAFTKKQEAAYEQMITWLKERQVSIPVHHVSNSAGIVDLPEYNKDIVRAGIILYGLWPSDEVNKENIDLQPLLSLKSHVVHVKELEPGRIISYGGTFEVEHPMRIATVPVGYADGYPRSLSNQGYVLIHGKRAAICGRVCMDQMMVDVTDIADVCPGDEVTLIGRDGAECITLEELGDLSGRFNYEFVCDLNKRIPRVYVKQK